MDSGYIFLGIVAAFIYFFSTYYFQRRKLIQAEKALMKNEPFPNEMIMVHWQKFQVPMRYIEFKEIWTNLSHDSKRSIARKQEKMIKDGKINSARLGRGMNLQVVVDPNI